MTMSVTERTDEREGSFRNMLDGAQAKIQTGMPGKITAILPGGRVRVQPLIQSEVTNPDGTRAWRNMPEVPDALVEFPGGGGMTMTFPIAVGDECWLSFSSRCIDGWAQSGQISQQLDPRMHDLSDAKATVGIRSQPNALSGISTTAVELRSDDGSFKVSFNKATGKITFTCTDFEVLSTTMKHNGINVGADHHHTLVQPGAGNSGPPAP